MNNGSRHAIEVLGLTKRYGQLVAVDHVSFEVRESEIFGFLGPNGAGKTTTVRMLTGVTRPDGGEARVRGYRAGSLRAKQVVGVVPEMSNAYGDLSGWDNLMLMAALYGVDGRRAHENAARLLQKVGLDQRRKDSVNTYSRGMKQRLILAMAMMGDPDILFLDEPTSGLDVQSARVIKAFIRELNSAGKTIFLTTHDMDEANQLCHRVAIINKGKLVAIDPPEKLRTAVSSRHSVEVSFDRDVPGEFLETLEGVEAVERLGDKYRLHTARPGDVVVSLADGARSLGVRIVSLQMVAPSLEDAFVALTETEAD